MAISIMSILTQAKRLSTYFILLLIAIMTLNGCYQPPYNNFKEDHRALRPAILGAGVGAAAAATIGSSVITATAIGAGAGLALGLYKDSQYALIRELDKQNIQFVQYGDTMTLLVPTDRYFLFDSAQLNDLGYPGLTNIIRLLRYYPKSPIYVAGFTDNIGSNHHKKMLSRAQAEAILGFLWANNIQASRLAAEAYGDKHAIGDNHLMHGSAYNRRVEIQWINAPAAGVCYPLR